MEVISGRPAIDYLCFLQMIIDKLSSKEDLTKGDLQTINDAKHQINLILNSSNMNKPFKKLLGNRVLLKTPPLPESKLQLSKEAQESLKEDYLKKLDKLEVYEVGDTVTIVKVGDVVTIPVPSVLNGQKIKLSEDLEVCLVSVFDISIIW